MSGGTELSITYRYNGLGYLQNFQTAKDAAAGIYATNLYDYDYAGRVIKTTASDSTQYSTVYDMLGRKLSVTDPKGNTTLYTYLTA